MASNQSTEERLTAALADRYTIEREIGSGGMATVYLAHDLKHARKVAVKVMKPDLAEAIGADRFLREIRTTANLSHPHILPLFDSGEADYTFWVTVASSERPARRRALAKLMRICALSGRSWTAWRKCACALSKSSSPAKATPICSWTSAM